jgi:hypothetical protein
LDDGRTGGSFDPKYIAYSTLAGEEIWKFPPVFDYSNGDVRSYAFYGNVEDDRSRIFSFKLLERGGLLIAKDWADTAYWVRTRDVKQIWPNLLRMEDVMDAVVSGKDLLALTRPKYQSDAPPIIAMSLHRIDRRTGTVRQTISVPVGGILVAKHSTLYLSTGNAVRAYALSVLFRQGKPATK